MVLRFKLIRKLDTPKALVLDKTKVLHGPRTQTYGETRQSNSQVLDRTKVLHGPRTQSYKETRHSNSQVPNRTKVFHGPRTQTYGETRHSNSQVLTEPRSCMVLGLKAIRKLDTPTAKC